MGFQVKSLIAIEIWKNTLWPKPNSQNRAEMAKFVLTTHDVYEKSQPDFASWMCSAIRD